MGSRSTLAMWPRHSVLKHTWPLLRRQWRALLLALVLTASATVLLVRRALAPPPLPPGAACPPSLVLVSNAQYLTRGNVGHWGYALFALHAALRDAAVKPSAVTLFFDARVRTGDWVRTMVAALSVRHGLQINLAHSAPGRCARPGGAASSIFAHLDANDAGPLLSGRDGLLRDTVKEVCQMEPQPVAVRDLVVQCRTALSLTPAVKTGRAHFQPQQPLHPAHMQFR
jgi:hypothetical protein